MAALIFWYQEKSWSIQSVNTIVKPKKVYGEVFQHGERVQARYAGDVFPGVLLRLSNDREELKLVSKELEEILKNGESADEVIAQFMSQSEETHFEQNVDSCKIPTPAVPKAKGLITTRPQTGLSQTKPTIPSSRSTTLVPSISTTTLSSSRATTTLTSNISTTTTLTPSRSTTTTMTPSRSTTTTSTPSRSTTLTPSRSTMTTLTPSRSTTTTFTPSRSTTTTLTPSRSTTMTLTSSRLATLTPSRSTTTTPSRSTTKTPSRSTTTTLTPSRSTMTTLTPSSSTTTLSSSRSVHKIVSPPKSPSPEVAKPKTRYLAADDIKYLKRKFVSVEDFEALEDEVLSLRKRIKKLEKKKDSTIETSERLLNGYSRADLITDVKNTVTEFEAVELLMLKLFPDEDIISSTISGKRPNSYAGTPKKQFNTSMLSELISILRIKFPQMKRQDITQKIQSVQKKINKKMLK